MTQQVMPRRPTEIVVPCQIIIPLLIPTSIDSHIAPVWYYRPRSWPRKPTPVLAN